MHDLKSEVYHRIILAQQFLLFAIGGGLHIKIFNIVIDNLQFYLLYYL